MGAFSAQTLLKPISADEPCGPDLEMTGDAPFMNFTARLEGMMPASYFSFDRAEVDFPAELKTISTLLAKSVDARLLVFGAKLSILNRDVASYVEVFESCAALLEERWEDFRPQLMDGDAFLRNIALQSLDDSPDSVMPLQSAPLFKTRRFGTVSLRQYLLSEGKLAPRKSADGEDEKAPTSADLRGAIAEADLDDLVSARDRMAGLARILVQIENRIDEKSTIAAVRFDKLKPLVGDIVVFLEEAVVSRDPSKATLGGGAKAAEDGGEAAASEDQAGAPVSSGGASSFTTLAEARAALSAADLYFAREEPSSPSRFFLAQAKTLIGKSFFEVLSALMPDYAGQASVRVVKDLPMTLTLEYISRQVPEMTVSNGENGPVEDAVNETGINVPEKREEALRLLDETSKFFRTKEPSSPIPFLLDQARNCVGKDFVGLLRETLPRSALNVDS